MRRKQFTLCIRVPYPLLHQIHRKFILHSPKDRIPNPAPSLCASATLCFKKRATKQAARLARTFGNTEAQRPRRARLNPSNFQPTTPSVSLWLCVSKIEPQNKQPALRGLLETRRHRVHGALPPLSVPQMSLCFKKRLHFKKPNFKILPLTKNF
jgi:hypothetical protein